MRIAPMGFLVALISVSVVAFTIFEVVQQLAG